MKDEAVEEKSKDKVNEVQTSSEVDKAEIKMVEVDSKSKVENQVEKVYKKQDNSLKKEPMLKKFKNQGSGKNMGMLIGTVLVVLMGIGSGWFLSGSSSAQETSSLPEAEVTEENGKTVGMTMEDAEEEFDEAEGILEEGGIDGEGTHHLVREGGESKYVYLTSLTLDLQSFVGKTVMVKGETMASQSAPWLMDVWVIKELE